MLASADVFQMRSDTGASEDWLRPLLESDPGLWRSDLVDAWSVHLYSLERGPFDEAAPQRWRFDRVLITRRLAEQAGAPKPIWVTELGWSVGAERQGDVDETTQARYVRSALVRALDEWGSFVARAFVYAFRPGRPDPYNLIRPDNSPRPAWLEIKTLLRARR